MISGGVQPGQVYRSCDPLGGPRIRIMSVDDSRAHVVDADSGKRPRPILVSALHASAVTKNEQPRRRGYVLEQ